MNQFLLIVSNISVAEIIFLRVFFIKIVKHFVGNVLFFH